MLRKLICRMMGHKVNRNRVWHDGFHFRTSCVRCRISMLRDDPGWRVFDDTADADDRRAPHPREREGMSHDCG